MEKTFIIGTTNFVAANVACKALKAVDTNEVAHNLYKKAAMKTGKIVITAVAELQTWVDAITAYVPANDSEAKICTALVRVAKAGLAKRTVEIAA